MQRPRLEFGTIQTFTGQPDCTVAVELPFINIALPDYIKHIPGDPVGPSPWQALSIAKLEELTGYLGKQGLLVDQGRAGALAGIRSVVTSADVHVRWVPGEPSDYLS